MKQKWFDAYMDTAFRFAELSYAERLKVGAVIVKDHRIISIGYNGTPAGWDNTCEVEVLHDYVSNVKRLVTKPEVHHAEENAILKLARDGESGLGATLFCTHQPCINCARMIVGAGIKEVYYRHDYKTNDGKDFLNKSGVIVKKI